MAQVYLLELKYKFQKRFPSKLGRRASGKERVRSSLSKTFQPKRDEMKQVFDKIDADGDGKISKKDLKQLLTSLRETTTSEKVRKMVEVADFDLDGCIDFDDFMVLHRKAGGIRADEIQSAFLMFDLDGDGRISAEDLGKTMERLGERCDENECRKMLEKVDLDRDGFIDLEDFMIMMTKTMELSSA